MEEETECSRLHGVVTFELSKRRSKDVSRREGSEPRWVVQPQGQQGRGVQKEGLFSRVMARRNGHQCGSWEALVAHESGFSSRLP